MKSRMRSSLLIVTVFWAYVTISHLLSAYGMEASLEAYHAAIVFVPLQARLLQHFVLYPLLLGCIWASLRCGWQPIPWRLPVQVLLAAVFAVIAGPLLAMAEAVVGVPAARPYLHLPFISPVELMSALHMQWMASAMTFLLTYGFALALVTGFDFYRKLRDSQIRAAALERALGAAHLASLRMQLSPHSLFNLLHTIHGQIDWDPSAARTMIVQLGDLLRRLLSAGEREFSRLSDELQFARLYLELQQRRFSDRLSIELPSTASLPSAWVPSLILQPLIENAVVHGLAGHHGPVTVHVSVAVEAEWLVLRVINDVAVDRASPQRRDGGIGVRNVRERLAIQFDGRAHFGAGPDAPGKWVAQIRMPLLAEPVDAAGPPTLAVAPVSEGPL